jgi:inorganic pyrophosphatase
MTDGTPFEPYRSRPWRGLAPGSNSPCLVRAYIEFAPLDSFVYEIGKMTRYLGVDRHRRSSSRPPAVHGFVPWTSSAPPVASLSPRAAQASRGPLDSCIFSELPINPFEVLVEAVVVGGRRAISNCASRFWRADCKGSWRAA